jgi:hypothetical protein
MLKRSFLGCVVVCMSLYTLPGKADQKGYVAPLWGVSVPSLSSTVFSWGMQGAYKTSPIIGVGPFFMKYGISLETVTNDGSASIYSSTLLYGAVLHVFFQGSLKGFETGLKTGIVHSSNSVYAADQLSTIQFSTTANGFLIDPWLSYEYAFGRFAAVLETSYMIGFGGNTPGVFSVLFMPRFRF